MLSDGFGTFGLIVVILGGIAAQRSAVPWLVALYVIAAYWFTASTSFSNPAITLARGFTNRYSGMRLLDVPLFVIAQVVGALLAQYIVLWLVGIQRR